jgi:TPP-dependent pyruvate/acetoin dehydrogenase alpha subunit
MGANAVVGGGLPAAVGAALAFKLRGEPRVSLAFFGDGATNIGTFHESMNLAQLWHLPVVFVCENNHWSESTPQRQHQPIEDLTLRAAAYGMEALHVDGQDVEAVHLSALEALEHARTRLEPVFLVCETERLTGHYIGDPQVYRDKEELRRLRATRDPIENLRERLSVGDAEWERLDGAAHRVADEAVELAKAGTDPDPADALEYVYSEER